MYKIVDIIKPKDKLGVLLREVNYGNTLLVERAGKRIDVNKSQSKVYSLEVHL